VKDDNSDSEGDFSFQMQPVEGKPWALYSTHWDPYRQERVEIWDIKPLQSATLFVIINPALFDWIKSPNPPSADAAMPLTDKQTDHFRRSLKLSVSAKRRPSSNSNATADVAIGDSIRDLKLNRYVFLAVRPPASPNSKVLSR